MNRSTRRVSALKFFNTCLVGLCALTLGKVLSRFKTLCENNGSKKPSKVLIAVYGVLERPRGCAYNATLVNVVQSVTFNYSIPHEYVTIAIRPSLEDYEIDGTKMGIKEAERWLSLYNSSYTEVYSAEDIDSHLRRQYGPHAFGGKSIHTEPFWRDDYKEKTIRNALRMFFAEYRLSKHLATANETTVAVVYSADIVLNRAINQRDVQRAYRNRHTVYLTANNDAGGYTDGFYLGHVHAVSKVLSSLRHMHTYVSRGMIHNDYERIVKSTFKETGVSRRTLSAFGFPFHDFIKVRASGEIFGSISCRTKNLVDEALCPNLKRLKCFYDHMDEAQSDKA